MGNRQIEKKTKQTKTKQNNETNLLVFAAVTLILTRKSRKEESLNFEQDLDKGKVEKKKV